MGGGVGLERSETDEVGTQAGESRAMALPKDLGGVVAKQHGRSA